jgi:hypothetical protein
MEELTKKDVKDVTVALRRLDGIRIRIARELESRGVDPERNAIYNAVNVAVAGLIEALEQGERLCNMKELMNTDIDLQTINF